MFLWLFGRSPKVSFFNERGIEPGFRDLDQNVALLIGARGPGPLQDLAAYFRYSFADMTRVPVVECLKSPPPA